MFILPLCRWALKKVDRKEYESAPAYCVGSNGGEQHAILKNDHSGFSHVCVFPFYTYNITPKRAIVKVYVVKRMLTSVTAQKV
jgi:hypothetical protein